MADERRRYTDEEFALILRKAMELQGGGEGSRRAHEGLTLDEMRAIARDVGVDPSLVDRATTLLDRPRTSKAHRFLGGPTTYRLEHAVPGLVPEGAYPRIVDAIRRTTEHHGDAKSELGSMVWQTVGQFSQIHVTVAPRDDHTELRVSADRAGAFVLTWFLSLAGAMIAAGIVGAVIEPSTAAGGATLFLGMASAGLATARVLWTRGTTRFQRYLDTLMEAVRREVESSASNDGGEP